MTDTTKNRGYAAGAVTTYTRYYFSTDSTWDAADTLLAGRPVPALARGEADTGSVSVTIPPSATGTFYIIAKADDANAISEYSEKNNTRHKPYTFLPDLVVDSLEGPVTVQPGQIIAMTATTKNIGGAPTSVLTFTRFYFSTDTKLDRYDTLLAGTPVQALASGASDTGSVSVTIPPSATGTFYIIARADDANAVSEYNETNNTNSKPYTPRPDFTVISLSVPSTMKRGTTVSLTDTVKNVGSIAAPATTVSYYRSSNDVLDGFDLLIGTRTVSALAPGESSSGRVGWTVPFMLAGSYYIIVKVDSDNTVDETTEGNNTKSASVVIN